MTAVPELTEHGQAWCLAHPDSMVARVALSGDGWPDDHRRVARELANSKGLTPVTPSELAIADAFTPPDPFSRKA